MRGFSEENDVIIVHNNVTVGYHKSAFQRLIDTSGTPLTGEFDQ
jgi:hypothetical protein